MATVGARRRINGLRARLQQRQVPHMNILQLLASTLVKSVVLQMTFLFWMIRKEVMIGSRQRKVQAVMLLEVEMVVSIQ
jgi:hypothetical protein